MTTKETLIKARKLIEDPADWKQGGLAEVDSNGNVVGPYCSLGAIGKTLEIFFVGFGISSRTGENRVVWWEAGGDRERNSGNEEAKAAYDSARALLEECLPASVHDYNDSHDHACVLAAFDAAIERA